MEDRVEPGEVKWGGCDRVGQVGGWGGRSRGGLGGAQDGNAGELVWAGWSKRSCSQKECV